MAVKLQRCKRWLSCKRYLEENYGISVHFSDVHHNYYSAWKYTTKKYIQDSDDDEEEFSEEFYESRSDEASENAIKVIRKVRKGKSACLPLNSQK